MGKRDERRERVATLVQWAYDLIYDEWCGTSPASDGNQWMAEAQALFPGVKAGDR